MIRIYRIEQTERATIGALLVGCRAIGFALELPYIENRENVSCIPAGLYRVRRRDNWFGAGREGFTYQVENVPGRDGILFHPGNTAADLEGCIAPGLALGRVRGVRGVLHSRDAFRRFCKALDGISTTFLHIQKIDGGVFHS